MQILTFKQITDVIRQAKTQKIQARLRRFGFVFRHFQRIWMNQKKTSNRVHVKMQWITHEYQNYQHIAQIRLWNISIMNVTQKKINSSTLETGISGCTLESSVHTICNSYEFTLEFAILAAFDIEIWSPFGIKVSIFLSDGDGYLFSVIVHSTQNSHWFHLKCQMTISRSLVTGLRWLLREHPLNVTWLPYERWKIIPQDGGEHFRSCCWCCEIF